MSTPPGPALVVAAGLGWNYGRSLRNRRRPQPVPTFSRWACEHKRAAVAGAAIGSAWLVLHWATYEIADLLPDLTSPT